MTFVKIDNPTALDASMSIRLSPQWYLFDSCIRTYGEEQLRQFHPENKRSIDVLDPVMTELFNSLTPSFTPSTHSYKVDQSFLTHRKIIQKKYHQGNRTHNQFILDLDKEFPEFMLGKDPSTQYTPYPYHEYDLDHPTLNKTDLKNINKNGFVSIMDHALKGYCDNFLLWEWNTPRDTPLTINETASFTLVTAVPYSRVEEIVRPSNGAGYYFHINWI